MRAIHSTYGRSVLLLVIQGFESAPLASKFFFGQNYAYFPSGGSSLGASVVELWSRRLQGQIFSRYTLGV